MLAAASGLVAFASPAAAADEPILPAASYPDMTTYSCRTDAIEIHPGQNLNRFGATKTCPNAEKLSGPGDTGVFAPGSNAQGYITRFRPSMVEILDSGELVTPSVWDLHLHHVVWIRSGRRPDVRLRRGEDACRSCRRATGSRSAATPPGPSTT